MVYVSGGSESMVKCPPASVVAVRDADGATACTLTSAIGAPFPSFTVPAMLPVVAASAHVPWQRKATVNDAATTARRRVLDELILFVNPLGFELSKGEPPWALGVNAPQEFHRVTHCAKGWLRKRSVPLRCFS